MKPLAAALVRSDFHLRAVVLSGNLIRDPAIRVLSEALPRAKTLWKLGEFRRVLSWFSLRLRLLLTLHARHNHQINTCTPAVSPTDLSGNTLGPSGMHLLCQGLAGNTTLRELRLDSCRVDVLGARRLAEALQHSPSLKHLALANNNLGDEGFELLREKLVAKGIVTNLDFSSNGITGQSIRGPNMKIPWRFVRAKCAKLAG